MGSLSEESIPEHSSLTREESCLPLRCRTPRLQKHLPEKAYLVIGRALTAKLIILRIVFAWNVENLMVGSTRKWRAFVGFSSSLLQNWGRSQGDKPKGRMTNRDFPWVPGVSANLLRFPAIICISQMIFSSEGGGECARISANQPTSAFWLSLSSKECPLSAP